MQEEHETPWASMRKTSQDGISELVVSVGRGRAKYSRKH